MVPEEQIASKPRLWVFSKVKLRHPFASDQLNHASYEGLVPFCERVDLVGMSTDAAGHEEHLGLLHIHGAPDRHGLMGHISFLCYARRLMRRLPEPTIVWASDASSGGVAALWAKRRFGVPLVLHFQYSYFTLNKVRWSWLQRQVQVWLCLFFARRADRIRSVARRFVPELTARGIPAERVVVLPSRTDITLFDPGLYVADRRNLRAEWGWEDRLVVAAVGSLNATKGFDLLMAALAEVRAAVPELCLVLLGDGPLRAELQSHAERLGLCDAVRFIGAVPHRDVPRYLSTADLYVLSSRDEAMPRSAIEASAMCLPVIATDVGGVSEVICHQDTGLLVEPSAAAIGTALRQLCALSVEERRAMGVRGREHTVEHFEIRNALDQLARQLLLDPALYRSQSSP